MPDIMETFVNVSGYNNDNDFVDEYIVDIDFDTKEIGDIENQVLVAGENLSQYIGFECGRYYDGIDLSAKAIDFLWIGVTGFSDATPAINVSRSEEHLRFAFLIPGEAIPETGEMQFCVEFIGTDYILKTQPKALEVKEGLVGSDLVPEPSGEAWYQEFQAAWQQMQENATIASTSAASAAEDAESAAADADRAEAQVSDATDAATAASGYLQQLLNLYPSSYVASVVAVTGGIKVTYANGNEQTIPVSGGSGGLAFDGGYQDEEGYLHLTLEGEDIEGFDPILLNVGSGGGGGASGSRLTFAVYSPTVFSVMDTAGTAPISYKFTSVDTETQTATGNGNLAISVGGTVKANFSITQGDNKTIDVFQYLGTGSNTVRLTITDSYGSVATRTFTITKETFGLVWSLGHTVKNTEATLSFYITPSGTGTKTIYTYVDGSLHSTDTVTTSGYRLSKSISGLTHGDHVIEVYGEMDVSGSTLESEHLTCAVAQVGSSSTPVVTADWPSGNLTQYTTVQIPYLVVDPSNNPAEVSLVVNGNVQSTIDVNQTEQTWDYRPVTSGQVTLGIMCGSVLKQKTFTVDSIGANVEEVTDGLEIKVDPSIMSTLNGWSYGNYGISLSQGFDTVNGGLQTDDDGVHCIRITAGDRLTLNYPWFSGDARRTGKEVKIIYKVADSSNKEAVAIQCLDGGVGFQAKANGVSLSGDQTTVALSVCEDEKTELDINIQQDSEDQLVYMWEKCSTFAYKKYAANENFTQATAQGITFGSDDADVYLYLFRGYNRDLTESELKANYIHDGATGAEILARSTRNGIYDGAGKVSPDLVAAVNPNAHVIVIDAPRMTVGKKDYVSGTIRHYYTNGGDNHNFSASMTMRVQGTSSVEHAETAGGNLTFAFPDGITLLADGTHKSGYAMHGEEDSIPITTLNYKKNIASNDHIVNMACSEWYQRYQPTVRQARVTDPRVRDCMEACMCVVFFHNTSNAAVQVGPDTVQADETIFFGLGNLCTDKDAADAYQYDPIVIEVKNNTEDPVRFKTDDFLTDFDTNFEFRYLDEETYTEAQAKALFQTMGAFVNACDWTEPTNTALPSVVTINGQAFSVDSAAYRKAKWKAEAANYFDMPALYWHHNMTLFHLLRDNRAKNMFWSYNPDEGVWSLRFAWDHDTGHCRNNEGYYDIEPGYMDFDTIGTADVFNGADNVIFSNLRECNWDALKASYINRESAGAWNDETFYNYMVTNQEYLCESLWIEDAMHNAIRVMENLGTEAYLARATGKMQLHLKKSLMFQKALIDSYYCSTAAISDSASFRGYTPSSWAGVQPSGLVSVTMYTDIYVNALAGSTEYRVRATAGTPVTIDISAALNDTEIYWRSAKWYQAFGSLAGLYLGQFEASRLKRVKELLIGSDVQGYYNTNFTSASFDNCKKLETLNLGGLRNAARAFDFSNNIYLKEIYTKGSGITGITFAKNGRLETAELNALASLYMSGLNLLESFDMESYASLTSLVVENSPAVNSYAIVAAAANLARVRLLEIDWRVQAAAYAVLKRLDSIHGIDDEGYDTAEGVVTGDVYFTSIGQSKYNDIVSRMPDVTFTYGELLEEVTVTFVNDDGTTLYVTTTERGGSVPDPIAEGIIQTPTKASTVDKVFTYYNWDVSLDYFTANATVTATYTEADRYYTVRFLDFDNTVLETYTVGAYGSASYSGGDLERQGYIWTGWDTDTSSITADTDSKATYVYPTLPSTNHYDDMSNYDFAYSDDPNDNSAYTFGELYAIIKTRRAATYLPIKSTVKMSLDTTVITDSYCIFNVHSYGHYELADNSGMSNVDYYMTHVLIANRRMNASNTNTGGWDSCEMRTWLNNTLYRVIPAHWRQLIAQSITLANAGAQSSTITRSTDYLRLMSQAEVGFDTSAVPYVNEVDSNASERTFSQYTSNNSRIKKNYYGTGTAQTVWLRSADSGSASYFRYIGSPGTALSYTASTSNGVCFGFSA